MNVNVAAVMSGAFGTIADAHADRSTLVSGIAAPVGFMTNAAWSLPSDFAEAV